MVKIKINIEKKHFYLFVLAWIILIGVGIVFAANPSSHGHPNTQIDFEGNSLDTFKAREICLKDSAHCQDSWAFGSGTTYTAGSGITILGSVIHLNPAQSSSIGGVKAYSCGVGSNGVQQKMTGISGGNVQCANDQYAAVSAPTSPITYTCTGRGYAVCYCPKNWVVQSVSSGGITGSGGTLPDCGGGGLTTDTSNSGNYGAKIVSCSSSTSVTVTCRKP